MTVGHWKDYVKTNTGCNNKSYFVSRLVYVPISVFYSGLFDLALFSQPQGETEELAKKIGCYEIVYVEGKKNIIVQFRIYKNSYLIERFDYDN